MNYRRFGNTELRVSEIGFGSWAIGGNAMVGQTAIGWGPADDTVSKEALYAALDAGINFFDTADVYGLGHSESLLGACSRGKEVIIATKVGNVSRSGKFTVDYSKQHILQACEASLRRLKKDVIDFYQLHSARVQQLRDGACIEAMQQLQQEGKIRYWGISLNSFHPDEEGNYFMEHHLGHGFQLVLNVINQRALDLMKQASVKGYGIIARMPLQFGLLTGKFSADARFDETDHRKKRLTGDVIAAASKALETVWALCENYGITKTQLALNYVLSHPEVSTVIPGMRTREHVALNTLPFVPMEAGDIAAIESSAALTALMDRIEKQG